MPRRARLALALAAALVPLLVGCLPYTVGSTARPVPPGQKVRTGSIYFIPNAVNRDRDSAAVPLRGVDVETRWGLDDRSDWGFRLASGAGVVASYKRLLGDPRPRQSALALEGAGGIVNFGEHLMLGGTLLWSAPEQRATVTPYGALRVMQVIPMSDGAAHDTPTIGAIAGTRFGRRHHGVSAELGVFYDRSALELRRGDLLLVPSISVHGDELLRMLRDFGRML